MFAIVKVSSKISSVSFLRRNIMETNSNGRYPWVAWALVSKITQIGSFAWHCAWAQSLTTVDGRDTARGHNHSRRSMGVTLRVGTITHDGRWAWHCAWAQSLTTVDGRDTARGHNHSRHCAQAYTSVVRCVEHFLTWNTAVSKFYFELNLLHT